MSFRETIIEEYFDRAVEEFDANPLAKEFLLRLANESPAMFLPAAMKYLRSNETSHAYRLLVTLALRHQGLPAFLADPAFATREVAQQMFKRFIEVDPAFDVTLARALPNRSCTNRAEEFDGARSARALDILDHNSRGCRVLSIVSHLPYAADRRVAAKATLFVGRRLRSPAWVANLLSRPDPRVRASAVESIWGLNTPVAIQLLEKCAGDRDNRVMGNALVGLYIAGQRSIESELQALSESTSPGRRSMAVWAMGKLAEPSVRT